MGGSCFIKRLAHSSCMTLMELEYPLRHNARRFFEKADRPAHLAELCEEGQISHFVDARCRSHVGQRHLAISIRGPFPREKFNAVSLGWVLLAQTRRQNCEPAIDAL